MAAYLPALQWTVILIFWFYNSGRFLRYWLSSSPSSATTAVQPMSSSIPALPVIASLPNPEAGLHWVKVLQISCCILGLSSIFYCGIKHKTKSICLLETKCKCITLPVLRIAKSRAISHIFHAAWNKVKNGTGNVRRYQKRSLRSLLNFRNL